MRPAGFITSLLAGAINIEPAIHEPAMPIVTTAAANFMSFFRNFVGTYQVTRAPDAPRDVTGTIA
jgi:hypothetical protein